MNNLYITLYFNLKKRVGNSKTEPCMCLEQRVVSVYSVLGDERPDWPDRHYDRGGAQSAGG